MRGAVQYNDIWELVPIEIEFMGAFIEERIEKEMEKPALLNRVY